MHIRVKSAICFSILGACTAPNSSISDGMKAAVSGSPEIAKVLCPKENEIDRFLLRGSNEKQFWEAALSSISNSITPSIFLADWKRGDTYELGGITCSIVNSSKAIVSFEFETTRLGTAEISAESSEDGLLIFSLFLSEIITPIN